MTTPTVFISYSHRDEVWKDRLLPQLRALETAGVDVDIWDDRRIDGGDTWYPEIRDAIDRAAAAVLLISANFLSSKFCVHEEVPALIKRKEDLGMLLIPLLVLDCDWEAHRWLKVLRMIPRDGKTIAADFPGDLAHTVFAQVTRQVREHVTAPKAMHASAPAARVAAVTTAKPTPVKRQAVATWDAAHVDLTHLPETGSSLFGRDAELELLDRAWAPTGATAPPIRVLAFTAHGGVGKSTLINHWLGEMKAKQYDGAQRVFGWSFYSQGVRGQSVASSDLFIHAALKFFGDANPTAGAAWDRGQRLAHLVGSQRALLVLDGLEPLQSAHTFDRGTLRDPTMAALLRGLTRQSAGLCLISTREPLPELAGKPGFVAHDLEQISPQAGRALLRTLRVVGTDAELEDLARRFGPHALTISLLGVYLREQPGHGVGPAVALEGLPGATPLDRVLAGFESWLGESAELDALRLLGLFDRPADSLCVAALRKAPAIPGLTDHLAGVSKQQWHGVATRLAALRLVHLRPEKKGYESLDAHPMLREYFASHLKAQKPEAWHAGNKRLYQHLCATTKEGKQPSLEDLQPLYHAVVHGCLAGLMKEASKDVFYDRIQRGEVAYSTHRLDAYGYDLGAVACFFEVCWNRVAPVFVRSDQAWMLNKAGICLRALGWLDEAVEPMRLDLELRVRQENWKEAAKAAVNLSELKLALGQIVGDEPRSAVREAAQAVAYAEESNDAFERIYSRTSHADALHQAGCGAEAVRLFQQAEALQAIWQPQYPLLYSVRGFQYADLLLEAAELRAWQAYLQIGKLLDRPEELGDIERRAAKTLAWATTLERTMSTKLSLLDVALHHLTLGRTTLYVAILQVGNFHPAASTWVDDGRISMEIDQAVQGLRRAGSMDQLPRGLLTRAWLRHLQGHAVGPNSTQTDLDQAWEISERGPMPLFLADIHLHRARLFMRDARYPWDKDEDGTPRGPADDLREARRLIEKHGYGRRLEELQDAEEAAHNQLHSSKHDH